jgi:hypothetical protein
LSATAGALIASSIGRHITRAWRIRSGAAATSPTRTRGRRSHATFKRCCRTHSTCAIFATSHISAHGGDIAPGHLLARLLDLVARHRPGCHHPAAHLTTELPAIFGFLLDRTLDATYWRAEQALRPAVVNRKVRDGALLQVCPRRCSARLHAAPPTRGC